MNISPLLTAALLAGAGYLVIVFLVRLIPKRQLGTASPHDFLSAIMTGGIAVETLTPLSAGPLDGLVMITTILSINYAVAWLSDRIPAVRWFISEPATRLVQRGRPIRQALRRELLTLEELMIELRKQGIDELAQVREAYMEADGTLSVIQDELSTQPPSAGTHDNASPRDGG